MLTAVVTGGLYSSAFLRWIIILWPTLTKEYIPQENKDFSKVDMVFKA